jgi:hypothetical protein
MVLHTSNTRGKRRIRVVAKQKDTSIRHFVRNKVSKPHLACRFRRPSIFGMVGILQGTETMYCDETAVQLAHDFLGLYENEQALTRLQRFLEVLAHGFPLRMMSVKPVADIKVLSRQILGGKSLTIFTVARNKIRVV